jgi:hypothetical protein
MGVGGGEKGRDGDKKSSDGEEEGDVDGELME